MQVGSAVQASPAVTIGRMMARSGESRGAIRGVLAGLRRRDRIDAEAWDELEETLLRADVGSTVTADLLAALRRRAKDDGLKTVDGLVEALRDEMLDRLAAADRRLTLDDALTPNVWLVVGVNGAGKTTTIGKLAAAQKRAGVSVLLAAGDTFRAAAAEQLSTWAERSATEFVRGAEGGDPASVIYDAIQRAASREIRLVLADTAGRLHTKTNLMEELSKVRRIADRGPGRVTEVLLVIDATTGQNGLAQAREFAAATAVSGVVLTKLDGSARGGIVFAIETTLGLPVKLVGLGEGIDDLVAFEPVDYVGALLA